MCDFYIFLSHLNQKIKKITKITIQNTKFLVI